MENTKTRILFIIVMLFIGFGVHSQNRMIQYDLNSGGGINTSDGTIAYNVNYYGAPVIITSNSHFLSSGFLNGVVAEEIGIILTNEEEEEITALSESLVEKGISVFPNPTTNQLNVKIPIHLEIGKEPVRFLDLNGRAVRIRQEVGASVDHLMVFDLTQIPNGLYIIELRINNHSFRHKVIKK